MGCYDTNLDDFQSEGGDEQLCSHFAPPRFRCFQLFVCCGRSKVEGRNPIDRLSWSDVRRDGKTDLSRNRCLVQATDCYVSEPVAHPNADQLEDIRLEDWYGRPSGSS